MMSNVPLIVKQNIIDYIKVVADQLVPIVEVSGIYPSTDDIVPYGVYVDDVSTVSRETYQLGVQACGTIYTMTDQFSILFVSVQDDPKWIYIEERIQNMSADSTFFNGYFEILFTQNVVIGNKSEKRTYTFNIKRLNFMDSH
jgi:hypothetical protein